MKTLVAYYSFSGNNELLARSIADRTGCDLVAIETLKPKNAFSIFMDIFFNRLPALKELSLNVAAYDNVICIAPIWAEKIASPMQAFLKNERRNINHYSFITVCGGRKNQLDAIKKGLVARIYYAPDRMEELWITDLLKSTHGNKKLSNYKLKEDDLQFFNDKIENFILAVCSPIGRKDSHQNKSNY